MFELKTFFVYMITRFEFWMKKMEDIDVFDLPITPQMLPNSPTSVEVSRLGKESSFWEAVDQRVQS